MWDVSKILNMPSARHTKSYFRLFLHPPDTRIHGLPVIRRTPVMISFGLRQTSVNAHCPPGGRRTVQKPDMYPSSYEEAECLCDGCIINGVENMTYNSVPVSRSHLFLKKVPCPSDSSKYALEYEFVSVTVACTCAVPDQTTI
ncbi:interleukin-17C isoform X2 [Megalobrama amblycephala]|uniref:interleukin-17C isoform X2 n=1 Tax=Megalobrama amblycephala TaxID=75352 RepID=UPI0020146EFA|nr:interleukin-17C isoform X2 [Megalobrama amblycephala]